MASRKIPQKPSSADPVSAYAEAVVAGRIVAGPLVRLACQRHLRDLVDGPARGLFWDLDAARRALDFFPTVLRLNGGEHEGQPFTLQGWQAFFVGSIFGWKAADGSRRFRVVFAEIGKGNGKSPLAAGIGLYMMTADGEARAEVYSAAVDRDQAGILFRDAVAMVDQSPALSSRITKSGGAGREFNLAFLQTASYFRPISSESSGRGKSGPRPHCGILDEVHEHRTNAMVEFMRAGTKGRRQALILMITNSGWDRTSVCWDRHEYGRKVLEGVLEDDAYFAYICGLDPDDKPFEDESCWIKANPNLGVSITEKYLREQVTEARGMPSKANLVRRLNFCEWTESQSRWISQPAWMSCGGPLDPEELEGRPCVAALDLSGRLDLSSLTLLFDDIDGTQAALQWHWLPEEGLKAREERDGVPWTVWRDQGWLRTTPGAAIDRAMVADQIVEIIGRFSPWGLAYDRAKAADVLAILAAAGITGERFTTARRGEIADWRAKHEGRFILVDYGQGFIDMEPAVDALDSAIASATLRHGDNPIATFCAANAMIEIDRADNRKIVKERPQLVIDAIVSMAMAFALREIGERPTTIGPSVYSSRGLTFL